MEIVFALAGVFIILLTSEVLWRRKVFRNEVARKFVHVSVGSFVAFWPYFMSWRQIQLISMAFLVVVFLSKKKTLFHAVHVVSRRTYGEMLFPLGIGLSALLTSTPIVFTAAILHLSLADGFAALVGKYYGKRHQYKIRNHTKSLAGTAMFMLTSMIIVTATFLVAGNSITWSLLPLLVWLPIAATVVENLAVAGTDNVLVPLLIVIVLQAAQVG